MSSIIAQANFEQLNYVARSSKDGVVCLIPLLAIEMRRKNKCGPIIIDIDDDDEPETQDGWLTLSEAGALYLRDRPHLSGLDSAKSLVSKACKSCQFKSIGEKRNLRIESASFDAWRLKMRDALIDQLERQDG